MYFNADHIGYIEDIKGELNNHVKEFKDYRNKYKFGYIDTKLHSLSSKLDDFGKKFNISQDEMITHFNNFTSMNYDTFLDTLEMNSLEQDFRERTSSFRIIPKSNNMYSTVNDELDIFYNSDNQTSDIQAIIWICSERIGLNQDELMELIYLNKFTSNSSDRYVYDVLNTGVYSSLEDFFDEFTDVLEEVLDECEEVEESLEILKEDLDAIKSVYDYIDEFKSKQIVYFLEYLNSIGIDTSNLDENFTMEYINNKLSSNDVSWLRKLIYRNLMRRNNFIKCEFNTNLLEDLTDKITIKEFENKVDNIFNKHINPLNTEFFNALKPYNSNESYNEQLLSHYLFKNEPLLQTYLDILANKIHSKNVEHYKDYLISIIQGDMDKVLKEKQMIIMNESKLMYEDNLKNLIRKITDEEDLTDVQLQALKEPLDKLLKRSTQYYGVAIGETIKKHVYLCENGKRVIVREFGQETNNLLEKNIPIILREIEKVRNHKDKGDTLELSSRINKHFSEVKDKTIYKGYVPIPSNEIRNIENKYRNMILDNGVNMLDRDINRVLSSFNFEFGNLMKSLNMNNIKVDNNENVRGNRLIKLITESKLPYKFSTIPDKTKENVPVMVFDDNSLSLDKSLKDVKILVSSMGIDVITSSNKIGVRKNFPSYETSNDFYNTLLTLPLDKKFLGYMVKQIVLANDLRRRV